MNREALAKRAHNVADLRRLARRQLPRLLFDFVDGGADDEIALGQNQAAFQDINLHPKPLNGTTTRDQSLELFGEKLALPVIIGPTGLAGALWPDGELEAARAAADAGTVYALSHGSCCTIEDLAAAVPGPKWMQVFMYRDRGLTRAFAERARDAGYKALILTTDNQVLGNRERDLENGFTVPPKITLRNAFDVAIRIPWLWRMGGVPRVTLANYARPGESDLFTLSAKMGEILDPALSWKDVEWLRGIWDGPLILKGILHPDEAAAAVAHGVDGIVVSNHGGRQLDAAPPTIRALPAAVEATEGRIPVLIDGGIRRGADVVKALALGATACLIGRPHLWGLAAAGGDGVAFVLEWFRRDIDRILALGGWDGIRALDRSAVGLAAPARMEPAPSGALEPAAE